MADTKTITAAISLAVAGAAVGFAARTPAAPPELPHSAAASQPAHPDKCLTFCKSLPAWCTIGGSANCVDIMRATERADGGPHFSCSEPVAQSWLDVWCPNHGEPHPMGAR